MINTKTYAILDNKKYIETITFDNVDGSIEIPEDIQEEICKSKIGHAGYKFSNGLFGLDKDYLKDYGLDDVVVIEEKTTVDDKAILSLDVSNPDPSEIAYFGNIWTRKMFFPKKGNLYEGHKHDHDHLSLLQSGKVLVEIEGYEPKIFTAPTYIVVRAEHEHKITALEDETLWWCIHASRDDNGEVIEVFGKDNDPADKKND